MKKPLSSSSFFSDRPTDCQTSRLTQLADWRRRKEPYRLLVGRLAAKVCVLSLSQYQLVIRSLRGDRRRGVEGREEGSDATPPRRCLGSQSGVIFCNVQQIPFLFCLRALQIWGSLAISICPLSRSLYPSRRVRRVTPVAAVPDGPASAMSSLFVCSLAGKLVRPSRPVLHTRPQTQTK